MEHRARSSSACEQLAAFATCATSPSPTRWALPEPSRLRKQSVLRSLRFLRSSWACISTRAKTRPHANSRGISSAGCRRFDAAIGGFGGCPFAQDALVGNIPTEMLLQELAECGARVPQFLQLGDLIRASAEIASGAGSPDEQQLGTANVKLEGRLRSYTTIFVTDSGPVRTITLNRPERRNAMTPEMQMELIAALEDAIAAGCRVLVLSGAGNAFCSGLDLAALQRRMPRKPPAKAKRTRNASLVSFLPFTNCQCRPSRRYTGLQLQAERAWRSSATSLWLRRQQNLDSPKCASALFPRWCRPFSRSRSATSRARDLLLTGRIFDAEEARRLGLVNEIVRSRRTCRARAKRSQTLADRKQPQALSATKRLVAAQNKDWLTPRSSKRSKPTREARETARFSRRRSRHSSKSESPSGENDRAASAHR